MQKCEYWGLPHCEVEEVKGRCKRCASSIIPTGKVEGKQLEFLPTSSQTTKVNVCVKGEKGGRVTSTSALREKPNCLPGSAPEGPLRDNTTAE